MGLAELQVLQVLMELAELQVLQVLMELAELPERLVLKATLEELLDHRGK